MADLVLGDSLRERLLEVTRGLPDEAISRLIGEAERMQKVSVQG